MGDQHSIAFVVGRWGIGGVERVTVVLAKAFARKGYRVAIVAFEFDDRSLIEELDKNIELLELDGEWLSKKNATRLNRLIVRRNVDLIINQWCVPYKVTKFLRAASKGTKVKLIAVHHNQPDRNKRISDAKGWLCKLIWEAITRVNLRLVYDRSDAYVLLSPSFVDLFKRFVFLHKAEKLYSIPNPLTLEIGDVGKKANVILYVGRLEETQKRFTRVLDVWRRISPILADWRLEVVGDGPDASLYKDIAKDLDRIRFVGFVDPTRYYIKSRILLLTSDFEGFALVLVEAMAHGCVPIVYASYPAAKDIVRGGGKLVYPPFRCEEYSNAVCELASNDEVLRDKSEKAKTIAKDFSVDGIVGKWEELFKSLFESKSHMEKTDG